MNQKGIAVNPQDTDLMFKLLSLDLSLKLYPMIGIAVDDPGALLQAIREGLGEQQGTDPPPVRVDRVLSSIRKREGIAVAEAVESWGATTFHVAYRAKHIYGYWVALLAQCRWDVSLWCRLTLPEDRREVFVARFLSAQDQDSFSASYEVAAAQLSEWDLRMKVNNVFHDAEDEVDAPEILLGSLASVERNRRFWEWVVATLTPNEVESFYSSAEMLVSETPHFGFIRQLCHPKVLVSLPEGIG